MNTITLTIAQLLAISSLITAVAFLAGYAWRAFKPSQGRSFPDGSVLYVNPALEQDRRIARFERFNREQEDAANREIFG